MTDYNALIAELVEITDKVANLNKRKKEIEAELSSAASGELKDTKFKSVSHYDPDGNKATYTEAQSLTIISPEYLRQLFGKAYNDLIKETTETKYEVRTPLFKRMLIALYTKDLTKITTDEFWQQLDCDEEHKKVLRRKLKGNDFEKDRDNLMLFGGFPESDASDLAYLFADAVIWSAVITVCGLAGMAATPENLDTVIHGINISVSVDETSKLKLERNKDAGTEESQTDIRAGE